MNRNCQVTHEELAAHAAGEGDGRQRERIERHLASCSTCRHRADSLEQTDMALHLPPPFVPAPAAVERTREAIARELSRLTPPEIMTLQEAASMLRLSPRELEEIAPELPAFELAGQIRIRRSRLLEWIDQREKLYRSAGIQSQVARLLTDALQERT